jgi:hypothetical protein
VAGEQERAPVARRGPDGEVDMTIEAGSSQRRTIMASVGLAALARHLASRRSVIQVITGAIVLAAVAELLRENQARSVARLAAWDRKQRLRQELASKARPRKASSSGMGDVSGQHLIQHRGSSA